MKRIVGILFFIFTFSGVGFSQCFPFLTLNQSPANPVCKNTTVTFTAAPSLGGISSYIWVVNGDTISNATSISTSTNGAHVQLYAVSDTCGNPQLFSDAFIVNTEIEVEYEVQIIECNQPKADVKITNITGGTEPYTYALYTDEGSQGEATTYTDLPVSSYPLVVTDANGCEDTTYINVVPRICDPIKTIPAITPNEDGYNDYWHIINIEDYPDNEVYIYDRWGQRVFHQKEYDNKDGWKAEYLGGNMPVSTYYYVIKLNFEKQEEQVFKGAVSVFR